MTPVRKVAQCSRCMFVQGFRSSDDLPAGWSHVWESGEDHCPGCVAALRRMPFLRTVMSDPIRGYSSWRSDGDPTLALVGSVPFALYVAEGEDELVFVTSTGMVGFTTDADCCSETWFADITGVSSLIGATVNSTEWLDLPDTDDGRSRQDVDEFYGFRIHTTEGSADVIFRNSSNGYYGGSIETMREVPMPTGKQWTRIEADWRAS